MAGRAGPTGQESGPRTVRRAEGGNLKPEDTDTPYRLEATGIRKRFGATQALDGVDLAVRPGEVCGLIGENGAGKSTLMQILSGALKPDAGTLKLDGQPYLPASPQAARQAGVAMIYQELSLAPHLSVEANIVLGAEPRRFGLVDRGEMTRRAREALTRLGHPELPLRRPAGELPIGLQQVVEIARAMATGCRVLILDEPTSSLSRPDMENLFRVIRELRQTGHAIVYISHFLEEVRAIADTYAVLRDGKLAGGGTMGDISAAGLIALMVGRRMEALYPRRERRPGDTVLELSGLSGTRRFRDASLTLRRGEILGLAGLVGAGHTELLRSVFGLAPVVSGRIRVGHREGPALPAERWRQGLGMLSGNRRREGLALGLSLAANLTLPHLARMRGWAPRGTLEAAAQPWVERLSIRCRDVAQPVRELSGGNQQKVALSRLLQEPIDVLLLDEPTRGIDVNSKAQIYRLLDDAARRGAAVLMVSSYLPELLGLCDRIAVMHRGTLFPARPATDWDEHTLMLAVAGGQETA